MPQKPNRSGQLQNYVPAGNGDASGEYGDNESGSNIHFKVFKRPDDATPVKSNEIKQEDYDSAVDYLDKSLRDYDEYMKDHRDQIGYFSRHDYDDYKELYQSDRVKERESIIKMANAYKKAAENGKPYWIVNNGGFSSKQYYFNRADGQKGIVISPYTFNPYKESYGSVWFHENGHLLDNTYENGKKNWSVDYVSKKYNDTLQNVLNEEFDKYFTKERKQEIIDKIEALRDKIYADYGYDYKKMEEQRNELNAKLLPFKRELKEKYAELDKMYEENKITGWQHIVGRNKLKEKYQLATWEITNQIGKLIGKKKKEAIEYEVANKVYNKYSTITDMYSSLGKGRLHAEYGGYHDRDYWKNEPSKRVKEFFAEAFSGKTLGNTHYDQLKEAFPKSLEIFEEIYREIQ